MKVSDNILFPTEREMRLYTAGLLKRSRKREIKMLSLQYELIADAVAGYQLLFAIWIKRVFLSTAVIVTLSVAGIYYQGENVSISSEKAMNVQRELLELPVPLNQQAELKVAVRAQEQEGVKLKNTVDDIGQRAQQGAIIYYEPDSAFIQKPQEIIAAESFSKRYDISGNRIRFVEGYMLSDHEYVFYQSLNVPRLGGVPAEFENRKAKENSIKASDGHIMDLRSQLDDAIISYSRGLYDAAISKLSTLAERFPNDVNLNFYLGMSYYQKGNYDIALYHLGECVTFENNLFDQEQDYYLAMCYLKKGEERLAREFFEIIAHSNSFYKTKAAAELR